MKKYLCVFDSSAGVQRIENVSIMEAESEGDAKLRCVVAYNMVKDTIHSIKTFEIDTVKLPFHYFQPPC